MTENKEFKKFIKLAGGPSQAAAFLNVSYISVMKKQSGYRPVSSKEAKQIHEEWPSLSIYNLLYGSGD